MAKRATDFGGAMSLTGGVLVIGVCNLLFNIMLISGASSTDYIDLVGIRITPTVQILNSAWSLAGVPIIVGAGVGALYRVEAHLRVYFSYLAASYVWNSLWVTHFLMHGSICSTIVDPELQRMGTAFVCGFTDTFIFFLMMVAAVVGAFFVWIVWSAAEEVKSSQMPELIPFKAEQPPVAQKAMGMGHPPPGFGNLGGFQDRHVMDMHMNGPTGFGGGDFHGFDGQQQGGQYGTVAGGAGGYGSATAGGYPAAAPAPGYSNY